MTLSPHIAGSISLRLKSSILVLRACFSFCLLFPHWPYSLWQCLCLLCRSIFLYFSITLRYGCHPQLFRVKVSTDTLVAEDCCSWTSDRSPCGFSSHLFVLLSFVLVLVTGFAFRHHGTELLRGKASRARLPSTAHEKLLTILWRVEWIPRVSLALRTNHIFNGGTSRFCCCFWRKMLDFGSRRIKMQQSVFRTGIPWKLRNKTSKLIMALTR